MSGVLAQWNSLAPPEALAEILPCCGSRAWARGMADRRPILDHQTLLAACDEVWNNLPEADWLEAFASHPRIGESGRPPSGSLRSGEWSGEEQRPVQEASDDLRTAMAAENRAYEARFHRIFIVCATGKSGPEILEILRRRLENDDRTELRESAEQQRQIAHIRLRKWTGW